MIHYRTKQDAHSSHQQILRIVRDLGRSPILDVGAAQGMLGQSLAGGELVIDAIEPNASWAESAKPFYRSTSACAIESASLPPQHYRVIVCADVLEHLPDPEASLARLRAAATAGAIFIISLPNVAHLSIRLLLLLGFFPRMERGILDKTHLHFFTRATAIAMLDRAGLRVTKVLSTPVPIEQLSSSHVLKRIGGTIQQILVRLMPRLFAFQWIFIAEGVHA